MKNERMTRRGGMRAFCLLLFCFLFVEAMQEVRCEERQISSPEPLDRFDERQVQDAFAKGIGFFRPLFGGL